MTRSARKTGFSKTKTWQRFWPCAQTGENVAGRVMVAILMCQNIEYRSTQCSPARFISVFVTIDDILFRPDVLHCAVGCIAVRF
jgi:hypothetical protein